MNALIVGLSLRARRLGVALLGALVVHGTAASQQPGVAPAATGRIVGRVIDAATAQGLPDVGVQVVGTTLGASTGLDGRFAIPSVPAGTVTIQIRRLGFTPKTVTGIILEAGQTLEQNLSMEQATVKLQAQTERACRVRSRSDAWYRWTCSRRRCSSR